MTYLAQLAVLAAVWFVVVITPGPNFVAAGAVFVALGVRVAVDG